MSKCPCKIKHIYFVLVNGSWFFCSRKTFLDIKTHGFSCSEPFNAFQCGFLDDFYFKDCDSAIGRLWGFDFLGNGFTVPYICEVELYCKGE